MATVGVEQLGKMFRVSPRQVQKFADSEGMPRISHGKYDPFICMAWFIRRLHKKVCGCSGPCEGLRPFERNMVNARAERKRALMEVEQIADDLVGLDGEEIRDRLKSAIKQSFEEFEFTEETD